MHRRRLPIGIQNFRELRGPNADFVDKTPYAPRLPSHGKHSFLYRLALLVAAACLVAGCRGGADTAVSIARDDLPPDQPPPPVPVVFGATADRRTDPFALNAAAVTDNILAVEVSYSGGCRSHEFVLTAAERFSQTAPVQLRMVLTHDANNDRCEAYPTEQHRFDLSPIRQRFRAAYGHDTGTVQLHLHAAPDTDRSLVYQF